MTPRLVQRAQPRAPQARAARARAAHPRRPTMLHPECPIEQAVHGRNAAVQAELMREIWRRYSFLDDGAMLIAEPKRLRVLARTERALQAPIDALRDRYGDGLIVEPPTVRYVHGPIVLEPWMTLLLAAPSRHLALVQQDLARRRGYVRRLDEQGARFVAEGEAPLAGLLGYRDWLDAVVGDGESEVSMWLSRYVPIDGDGPHAA